VTRARIAAALSTVGGITGVPTQPTTVTPGIGWPTWVRTEYQTRAGTCQSVETQWDVRVSLPALAPAEAADSIRDEVAAALAAAGIVVESAEPDEYTMADHPTPILRFFTRTRP
jgi:hypothetical protein